MTKLNIVWFFCWTPVNVNPWKKKLGFYNYFWEYPRFIPIFIKNINKKS